MKEYIASVTDKSSGQIKIMKYEYPSKRAFAEDLRANGYAVRFITTEEDFDRDCARYHEHIEREQQIRNYIRQHK